MKSKLITVFILSALVGCGTQSQYTAPQELSSALLHIETSSNPEPYNSRVNITTKGTGKPVFIGYLNSAVIGTDRGRNYLNTKVSPNNEVKISIYSAINNDIGVADILLETLPCFLRAVRFCEVGVTFIPMPSEEYIISQNADGLPCQVSMRNKKGGILQPVAKAVFSHAVFDQNNQQVPEDEPPSSACVFDKNKSSNRNGQ